MGDLGPLTTSFAPASSCKTVISGLIHTETGTDGSTTTHKYHTLGPSATSDCYPGGFDASPDAYYSPGVCPSGWLSACGSNEVIASVTETRVKCCPLGYDCVKASDAIDWQTLSCTSVATSPVSVTVPDDSHQLSMTTVLTYILINAAAVNVRWQRNDFIASSTSPPANSPSSSKTSAVSSITTSTSSVLSSITTSSVPTISAFTSSAFGPNLTSGGGEDAPGNTQQVNPVTIGVGVGVGVGVLLLVLIAVGFWWTKRRKAKKARADTSALKPSTSSPEMARAPVEMWEQYQQELQTSSNTHEMVTRDNTHEIYGRSRPAELPAERWM